MDNERVARMLADCDWFRPKLVGLPKLIASLWSLKSENIIIQEEACHSLYRGTSFFGLLDRLHDVLKNDELACQRLKQAHVPSSGEQWCSVLQLLEDLLPNVKLLDQRQRFNFSCHCELLPHWFAVIDSEQRFANQHGCFILPPGCRRYDCLPVSAYQQYRVEPVEFSSEGNVVDMETLELVGLVGTPVPKN